MSSVVLGNMTLSMRMWNWFFDWIWLKGVRDHVTVVRGPGGLRHAMTKQLPKVLPIGTYQQVHIQSKS